MTIYTPANRRLARALHPQFLQLAFAEHPDGADWRAAMDIRESAFHEAGHLWATWLATRNCLVTRLNDGPTRRYRAPDPEVRAKVSSAGVLAAATYPMADKALESEGVVSEAVLDLEAAAQRATFVTRCSDEVDAEAARLLTSPRAVIDWVRPLVDDWPRIHRIATALIDGDVVYDGFVSEVMERSSTWRPWDDQEDFEPLNWEDCYPTDDAAIHDDF